jgi:hypothetical protein
MCGYFEDSYNDSYLPENELIWKRKKPSELEELSYRIGYSDAYDCGFTETLKSLEQALARATDGGQTARE